MGLHTVRRARKQHPCAWKCGSMIEPGTLYVRSAIPPWTELNESDHWWWHSLHGRDPNDCPTYGGPGPVDPRVEAASS
jgi:hypothetical protein